MAGREDEGMVMETMKEMMMETMMETMMVRDVKERMLMCGDSVTPLLSPSVPDHLQHSAVCHAVIIVCL